MLEELFSIEWRGSDDWISFHNDGEVSIQLSATEYPYRNLSAKQTKELFMAMAEFYLGKSARKTIIQILSDIVEQ